MDADLIRDRFSVLEVASDLGLDVSTTGKTFCLNHDEDTPSMHLYEDHWFSYCCGEGGSVIDFVMAYFGCSFREAIKYFDSGTTEVEANERRPIARVTKIKEVMDFSQVLAERSIKPVYGHVQLIEERWPYMAANILTPGVPYGEGFMTPHYNAGRAVGIKYRTFDLKKYSEPGSNFTLALYNPLSPPDATTSSWPWLVCEGETDAICMAHALMGEKVTVFGLPSGAGTWRNEWVPNNVDVVFVCMDNDDAGNSAHVMIASNLDERYRRFRVPDGFKDAADALALGWEPSLPVNP